MKWVDLLAWAPNMVYSEVVRDPASASPKLKSPERRKTGAG